MARLTLALAAVSGIVDVVLACGRTIPGEQREADIRRTGSPRLRRLFLLDNRQRPASEARRRPEAVAEHCFLGRARSRSPIARCTHLETAARDGGSDHWHVGTAFLFLRQAATGTAEPGTSVQSRTRLLGGFCLPSWWAYRLLEFATGERSRRALRRVRPEPARGSRSFSQQNIGLALFAADVLLAVGI